MVNYESPVQNEIASTDLEEILFRPQEVKQLTEVTRHLLEPSNKTHHHKMMLQSSYYIATMLPVLYYMFTQIK